ncbi:MAG: hypothetical protein ABH843_02270 [Candidatus Omnitrophota bacterium]
MKKEEDSRPPINTSHSVQVVSQDGFASLIGILIVICIIASLFSILLRVYTRRPSAGSKETIEIMEESGIETSGYDNILQSTKENIKEVNKQTADRAKQYEKY